VLKKLIEDISRYYKSMKNILSCTPWEEARAIRKRPGRFEKTALHGFKFWKSIYNSYRQGKGFESHGSIFLGDSVTVPVLSGLNKAC